MLGDGLPLPDVDGDVLGVDALLDHTHLGVLATPAEQRGRLHTEVAHLQSPTAPRGSGSVHAHMRPLKQPGRAPVQHERALQLGPLGAHPHRV